MDSEFKPVGNKILSSGVVPVRFALGDWRLLILRHGQRWDFPAGVINIHEDAQAAAQREVAVGELVAEKHRQKIGRAHV